MKNSFLLGLILLFSSVFNVSFSMNRVVSDGPLNIKTLIVNGDVTVILINNSKALLHVEGKESYLEQVVIKEQGDTLFIDCKKGKNFKSFVTVYVPAHQLANIRINSSANVRSLNSLQVPVLDVVVNGDCKFSVSNVGKMKVTGTDMFDVVQYREERPWPAALIR